MYKNVGLHIVKASMSTAERCLIHSISEGDIKEESYFQPAQCKIGMPTSY